MTNRNLVSMASFGDYLREKMVINNWKAIELAQLAGVARGSITKWLNYGEKPGRESIRALAKAFNVPEQEVFDAVDGKYKPLSKEQRDAMEINKRYSPNSLTEAAINLPDDERLIMTKELLATFSIEQHWADLSGALQGRERPVIQKRQSTPPQ